MSSDPQLLTPLFDAMVLLAESRKVSFHTPGHKSGKGISTRFRKFVGPKIFSIDLTTLDEVDSLQQPKGVIKEAQRLAAAAYGADHSFFLLNGTSGGNHAMILVACPPEEEVLVARNAHRSLIAGLVFSGAKPVFFSPGINPKLKMLMNVSLQQVKAAIDSHPQAKVLVLTSPNYNGMTADLPEIISYAHQKDVCVLVDEAHGPHLHFHPALPVSAMEAGADLCVQSTHKIIGGMTQASMLHAKGDRIDVAALASVLRMVQSTSPSYILMASLDLARMQMATEGEKLLKKAIHLAEETRHKINLLPGLFCFDQKDLGPSFSGRLTGLDVTKLTVTVQGLGLSGYEVSKILNKKYQIQVEMADTCHILVIVSIGDRQEDLNRLVKALEALSLEHDGGKVAENIFQEIDPPPMAQASGMTPRGAFFQKKKQCLLDAASGEVCSEIITVYPPGIPVLIPGEIITDEIISYLKEMAAIGATVDGLSADGTMTIVKHKSERSSASYLERIVSLERN